MTTVTVLYADTEKVRQRRGMPFTPWMPGDPMTNMGRVEVEPSFPDLHYLAEHAYAQCQNVDEHRNTSIALGRDVRSMSVGDVVVLEADSEALACDIMGFRVLDAAEYNDITRWLDG